MSEILKSYMLPMLTGSALDEALRIKPDYSENIRKATEAERLIALQGLYNIYIPTEMSREIYSKLYLALLRSLNKKQSLTAIRQFSENQKGMRGKKFTSIIGGSDSFTIIGDSGIGKSATVSRVIDMISAQHVIELPNSMRIIPCVQVQTPADCSVKGLLFEVLRKVDETLNTRYHYNATRIGSTTDMLIGSVSTVALNHIGLLVVDEIQNVVNSKNGSVVVGMLSQLINNAGIGICMVGTPKSALFFGQEMMLARRSLGLSYCPICAQDDRERLGETYWHREHQVVHVDICPKHRCFLENSAVPIGSKETPGLYSAENEVPFETEAKPCLNERLVEFVEYLLAVFRSPVDMETDVPIGSFLHFMLDDKYLSASRTKVYSESLYEDYCDFFREIQDPMGFEGFRKIYNNYSLDHFRICQLAFFQGIPVETLTKPTIIATSSAMEELYRSLGEKYGIDYETVCIIGDAVISKYRNLGKIARKSGPKQREWAELDGKYLPKVMEIVDRIYSSDKPDRVSVTRVEREIGIPTKQIQNLPKCKQYIEDHTENTNDFRARRVEWAVTCDPFVHFQGMLIGFSVTGF